MTQERPDGVPELDPPPVTGNHEIDRALAALELGEDVADHPERIGAALDAVARAMTGPALPQGLRPRS